MIRTGDTPADERRRFAKHPPDILITTPESLFLLLTSQAREALRHVETVIVDEVHAIAGSKRGAHLALSLERLDELLAKPAQRIGLSATVRPIDEVARFLGGGRAVTVVEPKPEKSWDLRIVVPVEDMAALGEPDRRRKPGASGRRRAHEHLAARRGAPLRADPSHQSTIVFANSRRLAERLCARINELAEERRARAPRLGGARAAHADRGGPEGRAAPVRRRDELARARHRHGRGRPRRPGRGAGVGRQGLQRVGRAGHQVGAVSRGVVFPKYRGDLVECTLVVQRMREGAIEAMRYPRNPLDVLAQQIVAMVAMDDWNVDALEKVVRRAAPFDDLPRSAFEAVLDMLSGRYPSDEFAELRPRLNWDRIDGRLTARPGAQRLAVTSGGTIPDRGLYGVFLAGEKPTRVGELDEEMVYESRSARSSCSARRPGGSRTSRTTACSCPRRPASPARCRSGTATRSGVPSSSAARSARSCERSPR